MAKHEWKEDSLQTTNYCTRCGTTISGQTCEEYDAKPDCNLCHATDSIKPGIILVVNAWWRNGSLTKCQIMKVGRILITLKPLEGNPHWRSVWWDVVAECSE